jgi:phosphoenolpyruvate synthase/pyruvate phosphate dikinase
MAPEAQTPVLTSGEIDETNREQTGGKAYALARLARAGFRVPDFLCVTAEVYREFLRRTGLGPRIFFELQRKPFEEMRWEEIWDAALRIRNLFLNQPIPPELEKTMKPRLEMVFGNRSVVVRSSGMGEDSAGVSFAGLHESFVNIRGADDMLEHVRLVWASLWSDRALLYRQELGLNIEHSAMPVVIQVLIEGERSGVAFSQNPNDPTQAVIEAVYGLNQGLVDGTVEPDRWILDRADGKILSHHGVIREKRIAPMAGGVGLSEVLPGLRNRPPLGAVELHDLWKIACRAEQSFGAPQDVEWTFREDSLYVLQSRPITTLSGGQGGDIRSWYLSLHRSFDNLKSLRKKVEEEIIPGMEQEAGRWAGMSLKGLSDIALGDEIGRRRERLDHWNAVYSRDCIPLAHGMRLFGQFYNDNVRPADPYEFIELLRPDRLTGLDRNRVLEELAGMIRQDVLLKEYLDRQSRPPSFSFFSERLAAFKEQFPVPILTAGPESPGGSSPDPLIRFLLTLAGREPAEGEIKGKDLGTLEKKFFDHFQTDEFDFAADVLDLARASYRLRDDDNVSLGRLEAQLNKAVSEGEERLADRGRIPRGAAMDAQELFRALKEPDYHPAIKIAEAPVVKKRVTQIKARQLIGQPAGPGIATGPARVILDPAELFQFQKGEILVCDAVDPNMTFVVPLAAGIVERRGGMLIHGAIIAREYGLPCVTGIPRATDLIYTGQTVTVDGYLGIVILGEKGKGLADDFL